jgi:hypothetical protein
MGVVTASRTAIRAGSPAAADDSRQSAISQIATYIPSDVVATYIALDGIFPHGSKVAKWVLFGIGVGLCVLLPMTNLISSDLQTRDGWPKQIVVIVMAIIAFTAYALALPDTVFSGYVKDPSRLGGAAALVLALVLPSVASAFGINPTAPAADMTDVAKKEKKRQARQDRKAKRRPRPGPEGSEMEPGPAESSAPRYEPGTY